MKRLIYGAALLLAAISTGCDKNESGNPGGDSGTPTPPEERRITFTTEIAATRAPQLEEDGSGSFTPGDTFTLYAHDDAQGAATFDYSIGATALYWRDLAFAAEGGKVHFEACYPKHELSDGGFDFTVTQDAAGDLLWASAPDVEVGSEQPVALTFRHAMHRLVVKYTVEDPSVEASTIETNCTAYTSCRVDLAGQRLIQTGTKGSVSATGEQVQFLVLPQLTDEVTLEIRAGETSKSWKLSETDFAYPELEGGKQVTVHLKIKAGEITLSGLTIEGWGDQGTIEDEIEM